jgi:hypothetical protein
MSDLEKALRNQGYDRAEAEEIILEMQNRVFEGENPEEVLEEYGLEPDYIFDLI